VGSRDPILEFWDSLISRGRLKLPTSNLAQRWTAASSNEKKLNIRSKEVMWGSRDQILEFLDFANISRTVEAGKFKFGTETYRGDFYQKKFKIGSKLVMWGHVTKFWNFWTTLISRERLKQETSNLARRRTAVSSNETNSKLSQKRSCGVA